MKLTQTVRKGGCAAKIPALILREILSGVTFPPTSPEVLIDGGLFDDAAIFKINAETALVQTLDFFTPIVDDAYDFGAVASANALSDIYAMGGRPKTCMAILAAPLGTMDPELIQKVLQGASDIIKKSGASLVGGHSIDDETLKFGLSVTGVVHPEKVWANSSARIGDKLLLTKPLGTGTLCAAIKQNALSSEWTHSAIESMKKLNNILDYLPANTISGNVITSIHSATDVTGFGLVGHSLQMARASQVSFKIDTQKLPLLPGARECLEKNFLTKAHRSNEEYVRGKIHFSPEVQELSKLLSFDPQTSGGLLLSVDPHGVEEIIKRLSLEYPYIRVIGEVVPEDQYSLFMH